MRHLQGMHFEDEHLAHIGKKAANSYNESSDSVHVQTAHRPSREAIDGERVEALVGVREEDDVAVQLGGTPLRTPVPERKCRCQDLRLY